MIFFLLFSYFLLTEMLTRDTNIYDYFLSISNINTLLFILAPFFFISSTSLFTFGSIESYLLIRFKGKRNWYLFHLFLIAAYTTVFCLLLIAVMALEGIFVLNVENEWSTYTVNFFSYHHEFLENFTPVTVVFLSISLVWLFLFSYGLLYYLMKLLTGKTLFAFTIVFLVNGLNIVAELSRWETISSYLFFKRVNVFQYIYLVNAEQTQFPGGIYFYWLIIIVVIAAIGYYIVDKMDLDTKKGKD